MNWLRFKLIFIRFMFSSQWCHNNCCLCCSWCALKTQTMQNVQSPVGGKCLRSVWELIVLRSRVNLGLSLDSACHSKINNTEVPFTTSRIGHSAESVDHIYTCRALQCIHRSIAERLLFQDASWKSHLSVIIPTTRALAKPDLLFS